MGDFTQNTNTCTETEFILLFEETIVRNSNKKLYTPTTHNGSVYILYIVNQTILWNNRKNCCCCVRMFCALLHVKVVKSYWRITGISTPVPRRYACSIHSCKPNNMKQQPQNLLCNSCKLLQHEWVVQSDDACMPMQVLFLPIKQYETPTRTATVWEFVVHWCKLLLVKVALRQRTTNVGILLVDPVLDTSLYWFYLFLSTNK
jgi:hypothetical protein